MAKRLKGVLCLARSRLQGHRGLKAGLDGHGFKADKLRSNLSALFILFSSALLLLAFFELPHATAGVTASLCVQWEPTEGTYACVNTGSSNKQVSGWLTIKLVVRTSGGPYNITSKWIKLEEQDSPYEVVYYENEQLTSGSCSRTYCNPGEGETVWIFQRSLFPSFEHDDGQWRITGGGT